MTVVLGRDARLAVPITAATMIEAQAELSPAAVAIVAPDMTLTYAELNARANRLARRLVERGTGPDSLVALALPRDAQLIVAVLAVLKAGAGYLPLDDRHPAERIAYIVRDARPTLLLATDAARPAAAIATRLGVPTLNPRDTGAAPPSATANLADTDRAGAVDRRHIAYTIYTSGSTGQPKGVAVSHESMTNLLEWAAARFGPAGLARTLLTTSLSFDVSVFELFSPLICGGTVEVLEDALALAQRPADAPRATLISGVPSVLDQLTTREHRCAQTDTVVFAGENLSTRVAAAVKKATGAGRVLNIYGPTEATVYATAWSDDEEVDGVAPIGRPLPNVEVYVLDDRLRPVADGASGELYIAGAGLARCYVNRPELTAERFVACPFQPGKRMYRSGDVVRRTADGLLVFEGRTDDQVKIRGFRIELGEVQSVLEQHPAVAHAAVATHRDEDDTRLVGYVVPSGTPATDDPDLPRLIRDWLATRLPDYMVPSAVVVLDRLPLTSSGKLNRAELPAPRKERAQARGDRPANPREAEVCAAFAEVLGVAGVNPDDNFFDLGGHSLLAVRLAGRLDAELPIRAVFDAPTPAGLAAVMGAAGSTRPPVRPAARPDRVPLSPAQQRMWFLNQVGASSAYTLPFVIRLHGAIDYAALRAAVADLFARHEALRTVFTEHQGQPYQRVLPVTAACPQLPVEHADDLPAVIRQDIQVPFDLATDLPLRVRLFRVGPAEHVLLLTMHHIASDGLSMRPLTRDLHDAYAARQGGVAPAWPPLPVQYADYTLWQAELLGSSARRTPLAIRQLDFWRRTLRDLPEDLTLAADLPRTAVASGRGDMVSITIEPRLHHALAALARSTGTTVFMILQAAIAALLTRLGVLPDIPIGTPVAGRTDPVLDDLVGFFVNTIVLRTDVSGDPNLLELLSRVRQTDLDAFDHQDVPFEEVVEEVNPARSLSRNPLFQVMLQLTVERPGEGFRFPGLTVETEDAFTGSALFDLLFGLTERHGPDGAPAGIHGRLEYATDLYLPESARLIAARFVVLLESWVATPDRRLSDVDIFVAGERDDVLHTWNATDTALPTATLPELIERQVAATPDRLAIRSFDGDLTFAQLNERANRLARLLLARGAGPGDRVAVLLGRGSRSVESFLAVLKCGAAYLPIDPAYPAARIRFMVEDGAPAIVVAASTPADPLPAEVLALDDAEVIRALAEAATANPTAADRPRPLTAETPNYVIYTSGTTGRPKGVILPARVLINELLWHAAEIPSGPNSRVAQVSSVGFDVSEHEMLAALLNGRTLCIPDEDTRRDPVRLARWLEAERVTDFYPTNSVLAAVYEAATNLGLGFPAMRYVVQGGEALQLTPLVREFHAARPELVLRNEYGPSETHGVTGDPLPAAVDDWPVLPTVGRPIWNTQVYLLDDALRPVPVGVVGELYLAGNNLAHGYLGRPDLTAERFVANRFGAPGQRMYRSGDRGRWHPDGTVELVGRTDDQVKIRGIRVELGELNAVLAAHPGVTQAATIVREDNPGDPRLVAYVVPAAADDPPAPATLRRHVAAAVPEAVVPSAFVVLSSLPVNANGKVDRTRLPKPVYLGTGGEAPATPREVQVCDLFNEVLGAAEVGVRDNFFDLGGHSLLATRLVNRLRTVLGTELSVRTLFEAPTPAELAARIEALGSALPPPAATGVEGGSDSRRGCAN
ncbi:amino acid adenylation domain-containing protein [Micromonospora viridifaciens]|uniref:Amino acid adenylation domain-containing protein n=1 Tax=Micromonospora viridifaciens TaxID=1881 RepID=A0A1C4X1L2_MICVI|nr:non-ribosomal peptide synthetase [Micromonospora viridifaciens]SCF02284.1 amino acid adenylation domain-containing protein [Micromonospora viridifaciens]